MKLRLLDQLVQYPLCDFFLRRCVESMSEGQIVDDLSAEPELSLLQHFDKPDMMRGLENLFSQTLKTFGLPKQELRAKAEFNFDVYDIRGFESTRAVFRVANALSETWFRKLALLGGTGLADLSATKDGQPWFIEVKALVSQTRQEEFDVDGDTEVLKVDKYQPESCRIEDYIGKVARAIAGNPIEIACAQLRRTVKQRGAAKKMAAIAVNLLAADSFLDSDNLQLVAARLRGQVAGWENDYLSDLDAFVLLTDRLYFL